MAVSLVLAVSAVLVPNEAAGAPRRRLVYEGMRGSDVREIQTKLRQWGYYRGAVDGIYGPRTTAAVKLFQRRNGLRVDGAVGPQTWAALGYSVPARGARAPARPAGGAARNVNLDLLARLVNAEARGEPYEGQVAVAAVILNRIRDSRFPNTLEGVVYQPLAFESVSNGQIYAPVTASARRAARDALNGWDPTHGAVFFWNPAKPVSKWVWSRPIVKRIGNHVFAK